jgi:hypothetical protein
MPNESRKCSALCLYFLFIGVLIGISIDAEFRPNHIRFWVNGIQDLSFAPQPGDKIEWFRLSTGKPMNITFWGGSPCVGAFNPCIVGNIPKTTTYLYSCKAADDANFNCLDPQGGPRSGTQGLEDPGFFIKIFDLIENIFAHFSQIFSRSPQPGTPEATQNSGSSIATEQAKSGELASKETKPPAKYQPIQAQVSCESGVTHVYVPQQSETADVAIQASLTQQIQWGTSSANGLTISLPDPSTCSENVSSFSQNGICTVAKAGNYTASIPSCTPNTSESIAVQ